MQLAADELLALPAVLDEILDGAHFEAMRFAKCAQFGQMRHVAVGPDDFTDDRGFLEAREACQVDASLGV